MAPIALTDIFPAATRADSMLSMPPPRPRGARKGMMESEASVVRPPLEGRSPRQELSCKTSAGPAAERGAPTIMHLNLGIICDVR